jgi:hypothetical protein
MSNNGSKSDAVWQAGPPHPLGPLLTEEERQEEEEKKREEESERQEQEQRSEESRRKIQERMAVVVSLL